MEDLSNALYNRILYALMEKDIEDLNEIGAKIRTILFDYRIEPKEEALTVWTEGKNEYYIKRFLLAKAVAGCTKRTVKVYGDYLKRAFLYMGKDADVVSALDIQAYLASIIQKTSKANADNIRRVLSSFYGWMHREELISKNPMNKVDAIKVRKQKKKAFTDVECELLRNSCRTARERAIVEMLFSTGCRVSELVSIKRQDLDGKAVTIIGKGEKERQVYLNAKAFVAVQNYEAERKDNNPWLFPKMDSGCRTKDRLSKPCRFRENWYKQADMVDPSGHSDNGTIENIVRNIGKRAGVENVHPHRFRRTCATSALNHGMPIEQVSKMLGHEQLSTTQIYLDLGERGLEIAHERYVT